MTFTNRELALLARGIEIGNGGYHSLTEFLSYAKVKLILRGNYSVIDSITKSLDKEETLERYRKEIIEIESRRVIIE